MTKYYTIIAQEQKEPEKAAPDKGPPASPFANPMIWMMIGIMFLFIFVMPMMNRRQQREKQNMLAGLKKGAKVVTQSGILGTIVSVKDAENELTLRTDDSTNSRIRVLRDSITKVIGTDEKEATAS